MLRSFAMRETSSKKRAFLESSGVSHTRLLIFIHCLLQCSCLHRLQHLQRSLQVFILDTATQTCPACKQSVMCYHRHTYDKCNPD